MNLEQILIIFTRYPEAGVTKTRLIPHLGAEGAALFQKQMTEHTVSQARKTGKPIEIRFTGGTDEHMRKWLGEDLIYAVQGDGNLGERMKRAFEEHFEKGKRHVIIIGSDCPSNDDGNIRSAFLAFEKADCVLGPAVDGGYYLIGLKRPAPELFDKIDWGGTTVMKETLRLASGLSVEQMKVLRDVDEPKDIPAKISVIIPTLNESEHLPKTMEQVDKGFNTETIVVDGGSTDETPSIASECLTCLNGRAAQQNAGAKAATGEILLFLHADTTLPDGWDWIIRDTLSDPAIALGAFSFRVKEQIRGIKIIEDTANCRSKFGGMPFGDQGLFLRRETFEVAGGFPEIPIMEDYVFVRSLRKKGRVVTVPEAAVTSGRRWLRHGVFKVALINKVMITGYHLRIPPAWLSRLYGGK